MRSVFKNKAVFIGVLIAAVMMVGVSEAQADENPVGKFFKNLFKFPVKTAGNLGDAAVHNAENTGGVLQATGRNLGATVTGESEKVDIAEPLHKTGASIEQLVSEVAGSPMRAIEDINEEAAQESAGQ